MSIEKRATLIAWAAHSFGSSTRYDAADVTDLLTKVETFDDPKRGHAYVAVVDNNPKGRRVVEDRASIEAALTKRDWIYVVKGGFGELDDAEELYTRATIWEVPKRDVERARRIVREIAVELGLAENGVDS